MKFICEIVARPCCTKDNEILALVNGSFGEAPLRDGIKRINAKSNFPAENIRDKQFP